MCCTLRQNYCTFNEVKIKNSNPDVSTASGLLASLSELFNLNSCPGFGELIFNCLSFLFGYAFLNGLGY